ncbi:MAG: hypothetical protein ACYDAR_12520 [Thermomicrobiales bacterium]
MGRRFAAGITGMLFAIIMLALAAPVAADGLVTPLGGQDPNSNVVVVASPGFINTGTATFPLPNGGIVCADPTCGGTVVCNVNGCFVPTCAVFACNPLGYTAAGPIVDQLPNGVFVVAGYDGNFYHYTFDPTTRKYTETDANGNPLNDVANP